MAAVALEQAIDQALQMLQRGEVDQAIDCLQQCVAQSPDDFDAANLLGVALLQKGNPAAAIEQFRRATLLDPTSADAFYNLAEAEAAHADLPSAMQHYRQSAALDDAQVLPWHRLAEAALRSHDLPAALAASEQVLLRRPDDPRWMTRVAQLLLGFNGADRAVALLQRAARLLPGDIEVAILLYKAAAASGDLSGAIDAIQQTMRKDPAIPRIYQDHVQLLAAAGRKDDAVEAAKDYVRHFPDDSDSHYQLGQVMTSMNEFGAAALAFAECVARDDQDARGYLALGATLLHMGRLKDAREQLERAIELDPKQALAYIRLALVLERWNQRAEAIELLHKALELAPDDVEARALLAMLLIREGSHTQAAEAYRRCLELAPHNVGALTGCGALLSLQGDTAGCWALMQRAIAAEPLNYLPVQAALLFSISQPQLSRQEQTDLHRHWGDLFVKSLAPPFDRWDNDRSPDRKLKVGYVSADLRGHSVAYFLEPLLAWHQRDNVEIHIFDVTFAADAITQHLRTQADVWHRVVGAGTDRITEIVREQPIDILVDLGGHTGDSRIDVFARHAAPVQVSYLGYPATTGLPAMDSRLTDDIADPPGSDAFYTEKLIRLPGGFLCFRPPLPWDEVRDLPAGLDRPITFTSFNAVNKINANVLQLWARVLDAVPASRLLLKANGLSDPKTRHNLASGLAEHGISQDRFEFVNRTASYRDHLAVYHRGDIALDTFPYNGTTTTCEALWMGLPVIALAGDRHAARVSQSILSRIGMQDWIAATPDDYVRLASQWATRRQELIELRRSMRQRLLHSRLMDGPTHAAAVEAAFRQMWRSWCHEHPSPPV